MKDPYLHQPHEVSLETYAFCNARCSFCPYPTLERKGTKMPTELVMRLIDEMAEWEQPFFISPFKVNEPLLDSRLQDFCFLIQHKLPLATLRLFTNGQPLATRHLNWIADLKRIEHLWISLNEFEPQRYGELMGLSLSVTLDRLDDLHGRIKCGEFKHKVIVSRVSDCEPSTVQTYSARDTLFLRFVFERWPRFQGFIIKRDSWLGYTTSSLNVIPQAPCARWWEMNICADGTAALCCMDGTGEHAIGNVHTATLLQLYNRQDLLMRRQLKAHRQGFIPCNGCTY